MSARFFFVMLAGSPERTTVWLTSYHTSLTFTGRRLQDARRPRKHMLLPEPPQGSSEPRPSQLSQPPPSSLSAALSKFSTLQSAITSSKDARAKTQVARRYAAFAESVGVQVFPASEQSVAWFLIHFVFATGGSAKSLSSVFTALRQESALRLLPWLLPNAELNISRLVSQLKFDDTGDSLRKEPFQ